MKGRTRSLCIIWEISLGDRSRDAIGTGLQERGVSGEGVTAVYSTMGPRNPLNKPNNGESASCSLCGWRRSIVASMTTGLLGD